MVLYLCGVDKNFKIWTIDRETILIIERASRKMKKSLEEKRYVSSAKVTKFYLTVLLSMVQYNTIDDKIDWDPK